MFTDNTDLISKFGYIIDIIKPKNIFSINLQIYITLYDKNQEPIKSWFEQVNKIKKEKCQLYITTFFNENHLQNFELVKLSETKKTITFVFHIHHSKPYEKRQQYINDVFEKYRNYELTLLDLNIHVNCLRLDLKDVHRK